LPLLRRQEIERICRKFPEKGRKNGDDIFNHRGTESTEGITEKEINR